MSKLNLNFYYKVAKKKLFNLCRSLTGHGNLTTLKTLQKYEKNLKIKHFNSGQRVFDWSIPSKWIIKKAEVIDKFGKKIIDFNKNNLHLIGYSHSKNKIVARDELLKNISSLPKQVNAIPYITSYYKKRWGFCLTQKEKNQIKIKYKKNDKFKVTINSKFKKGKLHYGECVIKGKSSQEILISTYICHPSMANDNLSGIIVSMALISYFKKVKNLKKTIRFLFIPETIGSIAYINKNLPELKSKVIGGYNLCCIGDDRAHSMILTKYGNSISDKSLLEVYKKLKIKPKIYSFLTRGSDERQFNSPGVDLNLTGICRSKYSNYPEYHTSLDNFDIVSLKGLNGGFKIAKQAIEVLQKKIIPISVVTCEPQLGKRGLYPTFSKKNAKYLSGIRVSDFLQFSDGKNELSTIAKYMKISNKEALQFKDLLKKKKLISL